MGETLQSKGYGSAILHEIQRWYSDEKIIVSIEPCDAAAPALHREHGAKRFTAEMGIGKRGIG